MEELERHFMQVHLCVRVTGGTCEGDRHVRGGGGVAMGRWVDVKADGKHFQIVLRGSDGRKGGMLWRALTHS